MILRSAHRTLLGFALAVALLGLARAGELPSFEQVRAAHVASDALLLDRHGMPLADQRLDPRVRRLDWVSLAELSPAMREALLVAEDKRFFEHDGVDWRAFVAAAWHNLWHRTRRGASTLTMQLAGMLDPTLALPPQPGGRRSLAQKWDQGVAAEALEQRWSKAQILEAYLNLAPFRGDLRGVSAAAELLFDQPPRTLGRAEAALLAALLRGPNAKPPIVAKRACDLLGKLRSAKLCPQAHKLALSRLDAPRAQPRWRLAPHLAARALHQPGEKLTTTLDGGLQRELVALAHGAAPAQVAWLALDVASGEVRVWVGAAEASEADGVAARRPLTRGWWPYAWALVLERQQRHAASLLPVTQPAIGPAGWHSTRIALRDGLEAPLASVLEPSLAEPLAERLRALGLEPPAVLAPTAAADASLLQLAQAWRALLAGGQYQPAHWRSDELLPVPSRVLRPELAWLLADMAATPAAGAEPGAAGWIARSRAFDPDGRTVLELGGNTRYLLALAYGESLPGDGALAERAHALWQSGWQRLAQPTPRAPVPPGGLQAAIVAFDPPTEPARREWFLRATAPAAPVITLRPELGTDETPPPIDRPL